MQVIARSIKSPYTSSREYEYGPAPNYSWCATWIVSPPRVRYALSRTKPAFPIIGGNYGRVPEQMAYEEWQKSYGLDATQNAGATGNAPHSRSNFKPGDK